MEEIHKPTGLDLPDIMSNFITYPPQVGSNRLVFNKPKPVATIELPKETVDMLNKYGIKKLTPVVGIK